MRVTRADNSFMVQAMETMRKSWTDERLDDLNLRVENGFKRVDEELRALRTEMNTRFDALQRTMVQLAGLMIAALTTIIATQAGILATQIF